MGHSSQYWDPVTSPSSLPIGLLENRNPRRKWFFLLLAKRPVALGLGQGPHNKPLIRNFLFIDYQKEEWALNNLIKHNCVEILKNYLRKLQLLCFKLDFKYNSNFLKLNSNALLTLKISRYGYRWAYVYVLIKTSLFGLDLNDCKAVPFILKRRFLQKDANANWPSKWPVHLSCSGATKKAPHFWGICCISQHQIIMYVNICTEPRKVTRNRVESCLTTAIWIFQNIFKLLFTLGNCSEAKQPFQL